MYIEALETLRDVQIFYGKYQHNPRTCRNCGSVDHIPNEKMTDVNIAVELLTDAFENRFDNALLISADSDLSAPIHAVRRLFPAKRVIVAFPPNRHSAELARLAAAYFTIGRANLARSLFPLAVTKADGYVLHCPSLWR
jgi:hypothetical protein